MKGEKQMISKLIIFDFDGTIADSMWAWDELGSDTLKENGLPPLKNYDKVIRTMSVPDFSVFLTDKYRELGAADELMAKWHDKMIYNYCNRVKLKNGIVEFLTFLKAEGYTVYLASATHLRVLTRAIEHFDLKKFFDFIITEEIVGVSKRDPKIYELCMEKAGSVPDTTYLFEDAVHAVTTAKKLGINVCALSDASMIEYKTDVMRNSDIYVDDFLNFDLLQKFVK